MEHHGPCISKNSNEMKYISKMYTTSFYVIFSYVVVRICNSFAYV